MQELDRALEQLDGIVAEATKSKQKYGYFAALHRRSVARVKRAIHDGLFQDGDRMVRLEAALFNQYFRAFSAYRSGKSLPIAWEVTFASEKNPNCTMLQHLLLGMNAHLHLDLGIAAAQSMKSDARGLRENDFMLRMNLLLSEIKPEAIGLGRFARAVALFDNGMCNTDVWLARQGRLRFHESAWDFGKKLSEMDPAYWASATSDRDSLVTELAWTILSPRLGDNTTLFLSRFFQSRNVAKTISQLNDVPAL
jgi:Family of unknown function (DUF5995)